jgi:hypothetical protein
MSALTVGRLYSSAFLCWTGLTGFSDVGPTRGDPGFHPVNPG